MFGLSATGSIVIGLVSLFLLVYVAEKTVKYLIALSNYYGISNTFIGMTVVAVSTSLPEIAAHLASSIGILNGSLSYKVASATVLGTNIGSDVIQQTLVIGLVVLIMGGIQFRKEFLLKDYLPMIGTTLLTMILAFDGTLTRVDGLILLSCFVAYTYYLVRDEESKDHLPDHTSTDPRKDIVIVIMGIAVILVSAHFVLLSTEEMVKLTGVGGSMIGVSLIGLASALPEMTTAIAALEHKAKGISLGTLIGSNITNPLLGIGLGSLLSTYWAPPSLYLYDLPMETITAALLLAYLLLRDRKLGRGGAIYLIMLYIVYMVLRFMFFAVD